ncbi:MAG: RdgB/HAM1 family non-canonical purine NTP pyrophosphatase [Sulfolobales archaeon]
MIIRILNLTNNTNKILETRLLLERLYPGVEFIVDGMPDSIRKIEIQEEELEKIALYTLENALDQIREAEKWDIIMREDSGLFIESLKGFPGPFSSYVYKTIGLEGVLKLLEEKNNREAYFKAVIAYRFKGEKNLRLATGIVRGRISREIRGFKGFGFDPIFIPENYDKTFAELGEDIKIWISHRGRALKEVIDEYMKKRSSSS